MIANFMQDRCSKYSLLLFHAIRLETKLGNGEKVQALCALLVGFNS